MPEPRKIVENEVVNLDYKTFQHTEFRRCKLVYAGGRMPILVDNRFVDCEWLFVGEAQNTVEFLKALAGAGEGFEDLVRRTFFPEPEPVPVHSVRRFGAV